MVKTAAATPTAEPTIMVPKQLKDLDNAENKNQSQLMFKMFLLALLVIQNSSFAIIGRYTRSSVSAEELYVVNHVLLMQELVKFLAANVLEYRATEGQLKASLGEHIFGNPLDFLKILIPALLYLIQNSLLFVALSNLPAPLFQVTFQAKLLTTAMVSVIMLQRKYNLKQWVCLGTLALGVSYVVLGEKKPTAEEGAVVEDESSTKGNMFLGLICVLIACCCSAFAGVYTEKLLKQPVAAGARKTPPSLWMRNIQMAFFSVCIALVQLRNLPEQDSWKPFLHGFSPLVWLLVLVNAGGGLLVAAVMKYADNVLKGLAMGISVILSTSLSMALFGTPLTKEFIAGSPIVLLSVYFFSNDLPAFCMPRRTSGLCDDGPAKEDAEMAKPLVTPPKN